MRPIFIVRLVLCFLEAVHHIRSDPPITTIDLNFFLCGNMTVVFSCKPIHFKDDFFRATQMDHRLAHAEEARSARSCDAITVCARGQE